MAREEDRAAPTLTPRERIDRLKRLGVSNFVETFVTTDGGTRVSDYTLLAHHASVRANVDCYDEEECIRILPDIEVLWERYMMQTILDNKVLKKRDAYSRLCDHAAQGGEVRHTTSRNFRRRWLRAIKARNDYRDVTCALERTYMPRIHAGLVRMLWDFMPHDVDGCGWHRMPYVMTKREWNRCPHLVGPAVREPQDRNARRLHRRGPPPVPRDDCLFFNYGHDNIVEHMRRKATVQDCRHCIFFARGMIVGSVYSPTGEMLSIDATNVASSDYYTAGWLQYQLAAWYSRIALEHGMPPVDIFSGRSSHVVCDNVPSAKRESFRDDIEFFHENMLIVEASPSELRSGGVKLGGLSSYRLRNPCVFKLCEVLVDDEHHNTMMTSVAIDFDALWLLGRSREDYDANLRAAQDLANGA